MQYGVFRLWQIEWYDRHLCYVTGSDSRLTKYTQSRVVCLRLGGDLVLVILFHNTFSCILVWCRAVNKAGYPSASECVRNAFCIMLYCDLGPGGRHVGGRQRQITASNAHQSSVVFVPVQLAYTLARRPVNCSSANSARRTIKWFLSNVMAAWFVAGTFTRSASTTHYRGQRPAHPAAVATMLACLPACLLYGARANVAVLCSPETIELYTSSWFIVNSWHYLFKWGEKGRLPECWMHKLLYCWPYNGCHALRLQAHAILLWLSESTQLLT